MNTQVRPIPTPYAGSYYPIYNSGKNQWIEPTSDMPFDQISTLFIAFAHAYPVEQGSSNTTLQFEGNTQDPQVQKTRLQQLVNVARAKNPNIQIFISLGYGQNDWGNISSDLHTPKPLFAASVAAFVDENNLDGFDIDDESVSGITQGDFDAVIGQIRTALDDLAAAKNAANHTDTYYYYMSITPAFGTAQVSNENIACFNLINTQNYGGSSWGDFSDFSNADIRYFAYGVDSENNGPIPPLCEVADMAGVFNWSFSADSPDFDYTAQIKSLVGYPHGVQ